MTAPAKSVPADPITRPSRPPSAQPVSVPPTAATSFDLLREPAPDAEEDAWVASASDRILARFRDRYGHPSSVEESSGVFTADQK